MIGLFFISNFPVSSLLIPINISLLIWFITFQQISLILCLYNSLTFSMKKIKYGKRKNDPFIKQIQQLKQGDEICEAVLDTLGDDYLNYITHLVKHSKTPIKQNHLLEKEQNSSDSEPFEKINQEQTLQKSKNYNTKESSRMRHHSETGTKKISSNSVKQKMQSKIGKTIEEDSTLKNKNKKQEVKRQNLAQKKTKGYSYDTEDDLKKDQKTMSFTRNTQQIQSRIRNQQQMKRWNEKKSFNLTRPKYYTNYQQYEEQDEKISINDEIMQDHRISERQNISNTFISEIDNYISTLQSNNPRKRTENSSLNKKRDSRQGVYLVQKMRAVAAKSFEISKQKQSQQEELQYNLQYILKQNMKLKKKAKRYEQKIDQLQDEVSNHLIQCKNKQKAYKTKISELVKTLTQAVSKINNQKSQIGTMKSLLRSFGQKVKQIQNQSDESDTDLPENISQQINRYMGPTRHHSELRTKYKRGLQSTMPKHEEDSSRW